MGKARIVNPVVVSLQAVNARLQSHGGSDVCLHCGEKNVVKDQSEAWWRRRCKGARRSPSGINVVL